MCNPKHLSNLDKDVGPKCVGLGQNSLYKLHVSGHPSNTEQLYHDRNTVDIDDIVYNPLINMEYSKF